MIWGDINMKHMHFRNSCSYTCLALLLFKHNILTTDIKIAKEIKLPYYFQKEGNTYYAGGLIQGCTYFNMYLGPRGFKFVEETYSKQDFLKSLKHQTYVMFGVKTDKGKHAVILKCYDQCTNAYKIIWPDHKSEGGTKEVIWTPYQLSQRLDDEVIVGRVVKSEKEDMSSEIIKQIDESLDTLKSYEKDLNDWLKKDIVTPKYKYDMFFAFLVEIPEMLKLIDEDELSNEIIDSYKILNQMINESSKIKKAYIQTLLNHVDKYRSIILKYINNQ